MRLRRRPEQPHHGGTERWLVSYADFVTLLFAFFVVLYANSHTDTRKAQQLAQSFRDAVGDDGLRHALARLIGQPPSLPPQSKIQPSPRELAISTAEFAGPGPASATLLPSMDRLKRDLSKEIQDGRLEIRMERRGLVISLRESSFFPSGDKTVLPAARNTLGLIVESIRPLPNAIRLEGHTDGVPIHNAKFQSNWELSAARSIALMQMFTEDFALPRGRLSIAGFADTAPIATNGTPQGRARNRRVDIVILTVEGAAGEPVPYSTSGP